VGLCRLRCVISKGRQVSGANMYLDNRHVLARDVGDGAAQHGLGLKVGGPVNGGVEDLAGVGVLDVHAAPALSHLPRNALPYFGGDQYPLPRSFLDPCPAVYAIRQI